MGRWKTGLFLLLLTVASVLIHGYHPYAEDAEIYLPGVERILNPALFPTGQEFFLSHASMTLFPRLVAWSIRVTHLSLETALFAWHLVSIFLFLLACWQLTCILFSTARARWSSVCLIAALLTIPVAATALYVMDEYLNPRNLAAFGAVFAVARVLDGKYVRTGLWIVFTACIHPLMWVFPLSFCALWMMLRQFERCPGTEKKTGLGPAPVGCLVVMSIPFAVNAGSAYHEAAKMHTYFFLQDWKWYEWLGILAPLTLLMWFSKIAQKQQMTLLEQGCRTFSIYGAIYVFVSLVIDLPAPFETLARLQPMRSLHLLYVFLFVSLGGLVGEYVLKDRPWRWLALFVPLSLGMFSVQRSLFRDSEAIEWPNREPRNPWAQAFLWVRRNTPANAVFALNPGYMQALGDDAIGFRCLAQRSRLADLVKDGGVVSMFPPLADTWWEQIQAQSPWDKFQIADFARLHEKYGVSWVVLQQPDATELNCPYQNTTVRVCRLR